MRTECFDFKLGPCLVNGTIRLESQMNSAGDRRHRPEKLGFRRNFLDEVYRSVHVVGMKLSKVDKNRIFNGSQVEDDDRGNG